jgi:hypothetical protein
VVIKTLVLVSLEVLDPDLLETLQAFISGKIEIKSTGPRAFVVIKQLMLSTWSFEQLKLNLSSLGS